MTRTEEITNRVLDRLKTEEIEALGYFAARAEVDAEDWGNTIGERRDLLERAEHYRNLQLAALSDF